MSLKWRSLAALVVALSVLVPDSALAQTRRPTQQDLAQAFSHRPQVFHTQLGSCRPGTTAGVAVSVCNYCVRWIAVVYERGDPPRSTLLVRQGPGRITFQRAISYAEPSVQPMPGEPGVWVAGRQNGPAMFVNEPVPADLRRSLRYTPTASVMAYGEAMTSNHVWGGSLAPAVTTELQRDPALRERLNALMFDCATA